MFVALDHGSAEWVGIHAHAGATRFQALEPIRQSLRQHLAGSKAIDRTPALRHDHGSRYMSNHFQKELAFPGIDSSPAFRSPEGNGCAERFIPTLKENLRWVRSYKTAAELRHALLALPGNLQRYQADRAPRLPQPSRISPATASTPRSGSAGFNPLSQKPRAGQSRCTHLNCRSSTLACHSAL